MNRFSSFLFARPSFLGGLAEIMDFGNNLFEYNRSPSSTLADFFAISSDWNAIGEDLYVSLGSFQNVDSENTNGLQTVEGQK